MTQPAERKPKMSLSALTGDLQVVGANGQNQFLLLSRHGNVSGGAFILPVIGSLSLPCPCLVLARHEPALVWIFC